MADHAFREPPGQCTMTGVDHLRSVAAAVAIPVRADADTGHGGPPNGRRTARACGAPGAQAIVLGTRGRPDAR